MSTRRHLCRSMKGVLPAHLSIATPLLWVVWNGGRVPHGHGRSWQRRGSIDGRRVGGEGRERHAQRSRTAGRLQLAMQVRRYLRGEGCPESGRLHSKTPLGRQLWCLPLCLSQGYGDRVRGWRWQRSARRRTVVLFIHSGRVSDGATKPKSLERLPGESRDVVGRSQEACRIRRCSSPEKPTKHRRRSERNVILAHAVS
jgi:hypothetical protein